MSDCEQREAAEETPPQESPEPHQEPRGSAGDHPWENRFEKLWVEVETKEVKSTFRDVAAELRQKFGELPRQGSLPPAEDCPPDPGQGTTGAEVSAEVAAEVAAADDTSSDDDEEEEDEGGEPIMRPTAMARSAVLRTIPEQRESGLEDSLSEASTKACKPPDSDHHHHLHQGAADPAILSEGPGNTDCSRSPSPQPSDGSHASDDEDRGRDGPSSPAATEEPMTGSGTLAF